MNADSLKAFARSRGADLVGVAPAERMKPLPPESSPLSIFPECRSVIVLGRRILRGALRGVEEGTNFGSTYGFFGYQWLENNFLSRTTYDVTCYLEEEGFEAVPLYGYSADGMAKGVAVAPGKPAPNVILDMSYAAQAAGLGQMGVGGFFLTKRFGPRQRLAAILTDAHLEPDALAEEVLCGECGACVASCPLDAMSLDKAQPFGVPGSETPVAAIDYSLCAACPNGAMPGPCPGSRPDRLAAACARACVDRLERAGKLSDTFHSPFRKRTPWALDRSGAPVITPSADSPGQMGCASQPCASSGEKNSPTGGRP